MSADTPTVLLDIHSVKRLIDFKSNQTIYNKMEREGFPRPISCGSRTKRWIAAEVQQWIDKNTAACRGAA